MLSTARWEGIRLDIFFPSIPFYEDVLKQRVRLSLPGRGKTWVLSAESLVIFKLLFFRSKDLRDVEVIVSLHGELDRHYVRRVLVELVGETDARVTEWDAMVRREVGGQGGEGEAAIVGGAQVGGPVGHVGSKAPVGSRCGPDGWGV